MDNFQDNFTDSFNGRKGGVIRSIQRGVIVISGGALPLVTDVAISKVNLEKSIINISHAGGYTNTLDEVNSIHVLAYFTSATMFKLQRGASASDSYNRSTIFWTVIEFETETYVNKGYVAYNTGVSKDVEIAEIDPSKSMLFFSYCKIMPPGHNSYYPDIMMVAGGIISPTRLRFQAEASIGETRLQWYLVEFD